MGHTNFLRQLKSGQVLIDFSYVPSKAFIDATLVKGVYTARILGRKDKNKKKVRGKDVIIKPRAGGRVVNISREEFSSKFRHVNGEEIKLRYIKTNKPYTVVCNECRPYKVLKLPDNCVGTLGNMKVSPGNYVVAPVDSEGNPDVSGMTVISDKLFRKMFKIPMNDVISRNMNSGGSKRFSLFENRNRRNIASNRRAAQPNISLGEFGEEAAFAGQTQQTQQTQQMRNRPITDKIVASPKLAKQVNKYRFTVTHRVVDYSGKEKGFMLKELSTGKTLPVGKDVVARYCKAKLVDNIMLVTREVDGVQYLRGNGINIESLPALIGE